MDIMERALERRPWLTPLILGVLCVIVLGPWLQLPTDRVLGNGDMISWFFPYVSHIADSIRAGGLPLWNPCQFSGYSNVANPQLGLFYPITWLILVLPVNVVLALSITVHLWLAGVGMAVLLHSFGATRSGALLSGVVLVFSEYMAARIYAGHYTLLLVSCWLPWVLVAYRWAMRRGTSGAAALAGVAIAAALMPPLCTVGLALASGSWAVAERAALLCVANIMSICLASAMVFLWLGVRRSSHREGGRRPPR
jgi:hypothetical protein